MRFILSLLVCFTVTSCATVLHGTRQTVTITSNPSGALVTDGCTVWRTPVKINFKRKHDYQLAIFKPGFTSQVIHIKRSFNGAVVGNVLLLGSVLWVGVDAISGGRWKFSPESYAIKLQPLVSHNEMIATADPISKAIIEQIVLVGQREELLN
ncbi:MAG: hypothetical protein JWO53_883 [Chlamydiia bacterium]|nr:hypothetical protein [Chlamydiia bacterium]